MTAIEAPAPLKESPMSGQSPHAHVVRLPQCVLQLQERHVLIPGMHDEPSPVVPVDVVYERRPPLLVQGGDAAP